MRSLYSGLNTAPSREQNVSIASRWASSFPAVYCCGHPCGGDGGRGRQRGRAADPPPQALYKKSSCVSYTWWEIGFPPPGVCRGPSHSLWVPSASRPALPAADRFLLVWPLAGLPWMMPLAARGPPSALTSAKSLFPQNVQVMLTGSLAPELPDGLGLSPEVATMGLYQLGILWAVDQKPCPVLAREGPE